MKKYILLFSTLLVSLLAAGQAKKPILMVQPSDAWCNEKGFVQPYDDQGVMATVPDYRKALQTDKELINVISKINILMADQGFPLQDLAATLKSIETSTAQNAQIVSKTSGSVLKESAFDQIRRTAKADIILEVDWSISQNGPKKAITYNLRGLDAYTNKQIAGAQGTGLPSFAAPVEVLLEEAVSTHMDNFASQLQAHFDDMAANGREVALELKVFDDNSGMDFESEYDGEELTEIIDNWMAGNTVNHRFNKIESTENQIQYNQVRIPLYKENGMAMDTESFARELRKFLRKAPYNLPSKIIPLGLGKCMLIIGEK